MEETMKTLNWIITVLCLADEMSTRGDQTEWSKHIGEDDGEQIMEKMKEHSVINSVQDMLVTDDRCVQSEPHPKGGT